MRQSFPFCWKTSRRPVARRRAVLARGYNIESLTVAPTEDPTLSRMTLVTRRLRRVIEQITKQLNKLIEVVKLVDSPRASTSNAS
jgi:acetolactate synthase small subunit